MKEITVVFVRILQSMQQQIVCTLRIKVKNADWNIAKQPIAKILKAQTILAKIYKLTKESF
jgi:hypothetical protein